MYDFSTVLQTAFLFYLLIPFVLDLTEPSWGYEQVG